MFFKLRTVGSFGSGFGDFWVDAISVYSERDDLPSPVPLPGAAWLLLSALAGGGWLTRRRS